MMRSTTTLTLLLVLLFTLVSKGHGQECAANGDRAKDCGGKGRWTPQSCCDTNAVCGAKGTCVVSGGDDGGG
eukprot:CAMPEP_0194046664 /NCGR_PEP_ID=MMETSP0009_2-20130614/22228_1 /TAXON_ID=210454 /ORGANISM="Grammatophora oceanica, Strain CCMP 410" /LENGTH=71 /DNA_ID=CAMNT_0038692053 /DNA_START=71 /DNA_END=282 /DNA_ORIENTATION=+